MRRLSRPLIVILCSFLGVFSAFAEDGKFDLLLRNGRIVDGTGAPWYQADLAIHEGKIVRIGRVDPKTAERVIPCKGLTIAPGFIDMMGQTANPMLDDPKTAINLLTQGITTINAGEGASAAPLSEEDGKSRGWQTMAEYFQLLELAGLPVNVVQTVGHTQVRRIVMGEEDRKPTGDELKQMQGLVREAMEAGAIGVSTALIYPPAVYADTDEIAALAKVAGEHGGRYYTHMRNEGDQLLEAIDEALEIGRKGGAPVHIFHLKAAGRQNWPKMGQAVAKIKKARAAGEQVAADIYPYVNNGLGIGSFIHPRHYRDGRKALIEKLDDAELRAAIRKEIEAPSDDWENWFQHAGRDWDKVVIGRANGIRFKGQSGKSLAAIAKDLEKDPWDIFFELVKVEAFALPESMSEKNKERLIGEEFISFCTDVGPAGGGRYASHPRAFGSFPRLLSRYVRERKAASLERVVAQASAVAANEVFAYDRGRIAEGLAADVVVFDYDKLTDRADFADPHAVSEGMRWVIVNGKVALDQGKMTGARSGRVLRGPGYRRETAPEKVSTGKSIPELAAVDETMREFIRVNRIPGAALAITDQGRLVYARGFGYADVAAREKATADHLFRIASISKPITAVAILQLVEAGKLNLDDTVFDILKFRPFPEDSDTDPRIADITIRHLLEHRGGWDRDVSFDGMFRAVQFAKMLGTPPPAGKKEVIRAMISLPLDFAPGESHAYSNFGYCLLGRVIEQITGEDYEAHVKASVLDPAGATSMRIGQTHLENRHPSEVRYYSPIRGESVFAATLGQRVPQPYGGWHLEAMDSHGAWTASAIDLARFAVAINFPEKSKILKPASLKAMFARPRGQAGRDREGKPKESFYSLGWSNVAVDSGGEIHTHTGSLAGTATVIVLRPDGRNWVALFNARRSPAASHFGREIRSVMQETLDGIGVWPEIDLFKKTGGPGTPVKH